MKGYEDVTEVKIRPKTEKSNIYMEVSYIQEIQELTNITEKVLTRLFYNIYVI